MSAMKAMIWGLVLIICLLTLWSSERDKWGQHIVLMRILILILISSNSNGRIVAICFCYSSSSSSSSSSSNGVTADFMWLDRGTSWGTPVNLLPLTYFCLPKSARCVHFSPICQNVLLLQRPHQCRPICPPPRSALFMEVIHPINKAMIFEMREAGEDVEESCKHNNMQHNNTKCCTCIRMGVYTYICIYIQRERDRQIDMYVCMYVQREMSLSLLLLYMLCICASRSPAVTYVSVCYGREYCVYWQ